MSPLVFLCLLFPCLLYGLKRFEAGTPAIGEAIGLGAAIDYLSCIGMEQIHEYEFLSVSLCRSFLNHLFCSVFLHFCLAYSTTQERVRNFFFETKGIYYCDALSLLLFLLSRKSWGHISMKAFYLFQMSEYMVRHLPKLITVLLYALSILRMFILQTLQKFLISRYVEVSTTWFIH